MKKTKKQKCKKTSNVKQRNRLRNKGKLKVKKHCHKNVFTATTIAKNPGDTSKNTAPEEPEDAVDMIEKDDIDFLKKSISKKSYNLLNQINLNQRIDKKRKRTAEMDDDAMESNYEKSHRPDYVKMLLPVKTKEGIMRRYKEINENDDPEDSETNSAKDINKTSNLENHEEFTWLQTEGDTGVLDINKPISMAKIFAKREDIVRHYKLRIGILSSSLLENPEFKIGNLKHLLEIMSSREPELQITIKKLVTLSLMEIFKDLLPAYQIKHQDIPMNKLKKTTKELVGYEAQLVTGYKSFLTKLEKMASYLHKKKGDTRILTTHHKGLGELAVRCMCDLLIAHPYFNYAPNIVQLLTLYLDNPDVGVRKIVEESYKQIFREDKRGFISLVIVRRINHLVKARAHSVHCEVLSVLLSLRIKDVNLDQEKEQEIKNQQLMSKKRKLLSISKKERKRNKQLEKLENEMLEAKAEESKKSKQHHLTEVTKIVFLIYFRILKRAPKSNLLTITLEGLAKFAHCINLEYYQDLMNVLDHLLENECLNTREQLYCIKTVFIILSGYGEALNIDPVHFYTHLYRNLLSLNSGKFYDNTAVVLNTLDAILIHRHKKVTTQRMLSFLKRLATVSLQLLHNGTLASLAIIRSAVRVTKSADLLLDVESFYGQGIYNPEINEPEYCNAGNTSLWELCALQRHYHPVVCNMAKYIAAGSQTVSEETIPADMKLSSMQFYEQYDPSNVAFKPSIQAPNNNKLKNKTKYAPHSVNTSLVESYYDIMSNVQSVSDFSSILNE